MSDSISRQAAIDVAKDVHNAVLCCEVSPSKSLLEVVKRLESLPTAEPKTKCIAQIRIDRDDLADLVNEKVNEMVNMMSELKTSEWIPVSEKLPDIHDEVLVTAHGEVSIAWLYLDGEWRSNDMPQQMFKDIIAWMPLPEPYKKDGEV